MTTIVLVLIALGAVLLLGALGDVLFQRTGVPDLIFMMAAGLMLGPVLGLIDQADLASVAPNVAAIALVFVALDAGAKLKLSGGEKPTLRALMLAGLGFAATVGLVVPVAMIASALGLLDPSFHVGHALLLAAALGSTASALSIPAIGKARVDSATQGLLESESDIGSALSMVTAAIVLDVMTAPGEGALDALVALLQSIPLGLALGLLAGMAYLLFLRAVRSSDHAFGLTFAAMLIVFATAQIAHANALLAVVAFAVVAGNADAISQRLRLGPSPVQATDGAQVRHGIALVIRAALFVVAGMLLAPPWAALGLGVLIAVLLAGGRVPAVLASTRGPLHDRPNAWVVGVAMPRGAVALALALMPLALATPAAGEVASLGGASVLLATIVFVVFVLVLQRVRAEELSPYARDAEPPSGAVSVIDSTARPALEVEPVIMAAPDGPEPNWEAGPGPLSTRTPLPPPAPHLPLPRPIPANTLPYPPQPRPIPPPAMPYPPPPPRPIPPPTAPHSTPEVRPTLASEPAIAEIDAQAPETPRRYPAPPPPNRRSQGGA